MFAAMLVGYLVATVAFYSYLVATAQEEPKEEAVTVIDMREWQSRRGEDVSTDVRKAA